MQRGPGRPETPKLGDSWVVEEDDTEDSSSVNDQTSPEPVARKPTKSIEPEFIMPSMAGDSVDGSWIDTKMPTGTPRAKNLSAPEGSGVPQSRLVKRHKAGDASAQTRSKRPTKTATEQRGQGLRTQYFDSFMTLIGSITTWVVDILRGAAWVVKKPLGLALGIYLLFGFSLIFRNLLTNSVYASLSPICRIPGTSFLNLPFCPQGNGGSEKFGGPLTPVEFEQLITVQSQFEDVLEESAGAVSLPQDMKRGEASIRDLRQLVRYSSLHSKNELVHEFSIFIETAQLASVDLQRFISHTGRAVDAILSTTRWTARVLDGLTLPPTTGILSRLSTSLLAPFTPLPMTPSVLLHQYIAHARVLESEISRLIEEAQTLLGLLNNLEDRMDIINGIVQRDGAHIENSREDVLCQLWTLLGGNRGQLQKFARQLSLLRDISATRRTAHARVSATMLKLQEMAAGLEDLRERIGAPALLADLGLSEVPLEVHIENIRLGVERLELGRGVLRDKEYERFRRRLEGTRELEG